VHGQAFTTVAKAAQRVVAATLRTIFAEPDGDGCPQDDRPHPARLRAAVPQTGRRLCALTAVLYHCGALRVAVRDCQLLRVRSAAPPRCHLFELHPGRGFSYAK
jgi:hypothetical protein